MSMNKKAKKDWYAPLRDVASKGSQTDPVGGLAGLAAAREKHLGQFWTPDSVVRWIWSALGVEGVARSSSRYGKVSLLDNSFGSGRMFQLADPARFSLFGIEVDPEVAAPVREAVAAAGFEAQLEVGSMEEFRLAAGTYDLGIVNPPFSISIDNPLVEKFPFNAFGRYGAKSSTVSHRYGVAQALATCRSGRRRIPSRRCRRRR